MTKDEIDNKYILLHNQLEADFYEVIDEGLPTQHRQLKVGKSRKTFDLAHGQIWKDHEVELTTSGYVNGPTRFASDQGWEHVPESI